VSAADLLSELHTTRTRVEQGEDVDIASCEALIGRVNQHAASAPPAELESLQAGVKALTDAVQSRMTEIDQKLRRIRKGRKGVHGYARLRSHSTAQRLRKRV
jgi:hypothetical protein